MASRSRMPGGVPEGTGEARALLAGCICDAADTAEIPDPRQRPKFRNVEFSIWPNVLALPEAGRLCRRHWTEHNMTPHTRKHAWETDTFTSAGPGPRIFTKARLQRNAPPIAPIARFGPAALAPSAISASAARSPTPTRSGATAPSGRISSSAPARTRRTGCPPRTCSSARTASRTIHR